MFNCLGRTVHRRHCRSTLAIAGLQLEELARFGMCCQRVAVTVTTTMTAYDVAPVLQCQVSTES